MQVWVHSWLSVNHNWMIEVLVIRVLNGKPDLITPDQRFINAISGFSENLELCVGSLFQGFEVKQFRIAQV